MRSAASPREVRVHRGSGGKGRTRVRAPRVRTGMPSVALTKAEFVKRFRARFYDPAFEREGEAIAAAAEAAHGLDDDALAAGLQEWFRLWVAEGFFQAIS